MKAKLLLASALLLGLSSPIAFSQTRARQACLTPIGYRIGALDSRFGITREDFGRAVEEAAGLWESAAGRKLFVRGGAVKINLVYDNRQETTKRVIAARASISGKLKDADLIKDRLRILQDKFRYLDQTYSDQLASYEKREDDYNKLVAHWNAKGGAPGGEYQNLLSERSSLRKQVQALEEKRQELNRLTDVINAQVDSHNALLRRANAEANALNESGATGVAFEEGVYIRQGGEERIDIFQFDGETALRIILAHELGHALGIRHNGNPSSIMSPLIHGDRFALTAEDGEGLKAACLVR
jgi:hypothetical protein